MAASCSSYVHGVFLPRLSHSKTHFILKNKTFFLTHSQSLSFNSNLSLNSQILMQKLQVRVRKNQKHDTLRVPIVYSAHSNFFRAIQTILKVGKDGIEAGTNLVPVAVPRPIARLSVAVVATGLSLFVLKSFVSTVFFALGLMGFVYFVYLALNKDKGPKLDERSSATSTDEAIEEAKKIMDKYK